LTLENLNMNNIDTTPANPLPARLAAWQHRAGLSPAGLAALIGVPVFTYRKWADGTRQPDAAALRLLDLVEALQLMAPDILAALPALPAPAAQGGPQRTRSRPVKAQVAPGVENAPAA
jgi:hypothetical protein